MERERLQVNLSKNVQEDSVVYRLMRLAWSSTDVFALAPLQDLLGLGDDCRMNLPGTSG